MNNKRKLYGIISFLLFFVSITVLTVIDKTSTIKLSFVIQIILILYLSKITYGCILYIKEQYNKHKYSYSIVMNLGLVIFLVINISRQINLLILNLHMANINDIYNNTINSFSYFSFLTLPLIIILGIYSIITNIVLIYKESFKFHNLLGIIFGVFLLFGAIASQSIFEITKKLSFISSQIFVKKFVDISVNSVLCYFYCLTLATIYCNVMAANHKPGYDKDYIIILGAKIRKDGTLTPILQDRVDKALEFAKEQIEEANKNIVFIPSGGKGEDEIISEADAMKNYLLKKGISIENIIVENRSKNTYQNMRFSKQKIDEINKEGKVIFSTTNYHVFRSGVIANNEGIDCEGIGSKTKWYFYTNALVREFIANIFSQKKQHLFLVLLINLILFLLVLIGYKYSLF